MNDEYRPVEEKPTTPSERSSYWRMAKGLQAVDNLTTTPYLDEVADKHIAGEYTAHEAATIIENYYRARREHNESREGEEADLVSSRIVELLASESFTYRPSMLSFIHGELFEGLIDAPYDRQYRDYNITKSEPVLAGESVVYAPYQTISDNIAYDFNTFDYRGFTLPAEGLGEGGEALITFISNLWQTHPFVEGNTRTVAVFTEMLLRTKGANIDNELFATHSKYFRNALVRASYSSLRDGILEDDTHLRNFFENLLTFANHPLRNRDLYCDPLYANKNLPLPSEAFQEHQSLAVPRSVKQQSAVEIARESKFLSSHFPS